MGGARERRDTCCEEVVEAPECEALRSLEGAERRQENFGSGEKDLQDSKVSKTVLQVVRSAALTADKSGQARQDQR